MTDMRNVHVLTSGAVSPEEAAHAREVVASAVERLGPPPATASVMLTVVADPDLPRPALMRVTVDHGGRIVRAQAAAPSPREAVDLLRERLAVRMAYLRAG
jgi:hypothetical protein